MDIKKLQNCTLTTYKKGEEVKIYDFVADSGYCFRNNADIQTDENGNEHFDHFTAFSLLASEIETLSNFECVKFEKGMVMH